MDGHDDLKLIVGIGATNEKHLNDAGIHTFSQLAALSPQKVRAVVPKVIGVPDDHLLEHISGWIEQADQLATRADLDIFEKDVIIPNGHLHYASFTVKLTLDENNAIRITRVVDVQSQSSDGWSGWEEGRLLDFISYNSGVKFPRECSQAHPVKAVDSPAKGMLISPDTAEAAGTMQVSGIITVGRPVVEGCGCVGTHQVVQADCPFTLSFPVDLTGLKANPKVPLGYSLMVYAKKIGNGARQIVGSAAGTLIPVNCPSLLVQDIQLASGLYRMYAFIELKPDKELSIPAAGLRTITESNLLTAV